MTLTVVLLGAVSALPLSVRAQATAPTEVSPKKLLAEARASLPRVSDEYGTPIYYLCQMAKIEALLGDQDAAKKTVADIQKRIASRKPPYVDSALQSVLTNLAYTQSALGETEAALKTIATIKDPDTRQMVIAGLVRDRAEVGDIPGVEKAAQRLKKDEERHRVFGEIIEERFKAGDMVTAKALLEKELKTPDNAALNLVSIVRLLIASGDLSTAIQASDALKESFDYAQTRYIIATAQAKAGDKEAAAKSMEGLESSSDSSGTMYEIQDLATLAVAKSALGDTESAKSIFADASLKAQKVDDLMRSECYVAIATAQAETGDTTGAKASMAIAKRIAARQDDFRKGEQLAPVALAQVQIGDLAGAKETAKLLKERVIVNTRSFPSELAVALLKAGDEPGALAVLAAQPDPFEREEGYTALAVEEVKRGNQANALQMMGKIRSDSEYLIAAKLELAATVLKQNKK